MVADPYRWLEDAGSPETQAFIEDQNTLTRTVLDALPQRAALLERLGELWNYPRRSAVWKEGGAYFQLRNSGLQNQLLYVMDSPTAEGRILLNPNTLSSDGTVALSGLAVSRDASRLAYAVSAGGSELAGVAGARRRQRRGPAGCPARRAEFSGATWRPGRQRLPLRPL